MDSSPHVSMVTGGGSGLGAACVDALVQRGGRVVVADLNEAAAAAMAGKHQDAVQAVAADVTDPQSVQTAIEVATERFGPLRAVVQCAGVLHAAKIVGRKGCYPLDAFTRVVQVNLIGTFNVLRLAAAAMVQNTPQEDGGRGVIINTASVAAWDGQIGQAAYAASKAGVTGLTLPAARELASHGIRVVSIAPGVFETPMMASLKGEARASLEAQVPFPSRLGRPSEFAALVVHVLENPMVNGTTLRIDGALRMAAR